MSKDFSGYFHRYLGRTVSVVTWDHVKVIGNLSEVTQDSVLMTNVLVRDSFESDAWSAHLVVEDVIENRGNLWSEIVIQRHLISSVILVDPRGAVNPETQANASTPQCEPIDSTDSAEAMFAIPQEVHASIESDAVQIELDWDLNSLFEQSPDNSKPLNARVKAIRIDLEKMHGFELRAFRINQNNFDLASNQFRLLVHGAEIFRTEIQPNMRKPR